MRRGDIADILEMLRHSRWYFEPGGAANVDYGRQHRHQPARGRQFLPAACPAPGEPWIVLLGIQAIGALMNAGDRMHPGKGDIFKLMDHAQTNVRIGHICLRRPQTPIARSAGACSSTPSSRRRPAPIERSHDLLAAPCKKCKSGQGVIAAAVCGLGILWLWKWPGSDAQIHIQIRTLRQFHQPFSPPNDEQSGTKREGLLRHARRNAQGSIERRCGYLASRRAALAPDRSAHFLLADCSKI